jgi:hypothetical protein
MNSIKLNGKLTPEDYLEANLLHLRRTGWARVVFTAFIAIIFCAIILLFIYYGIEAYYLCAPVIVLVLLFIVWRFMLLPRNIKRLYTQQKDLGSPFEIELDEDSFCSSNEYGHSRYPWDHFVKWKENEKLILLYLSDAVITMLPKRIFTQESQIHFLKQKLSENDAPVKEGFSHSSVLIMVILVIVIFILVIQFRAQSY